MLRSCGVAAGVPILALALAACGDDSASTSSEAASSGSASSTSSSPASSGTSGEGGSGTPAGTGGAGGAPGTEGDGGDGGSGGAEPAAIDDVFRSGSRLRAIIEDGGGDARRLLGWRDVELGVDCAVVRDSGGIDRCLPDQRPVHYIDDRCSQQATRPYSGCHPEVDYLVEQVRSTDDCNANDTRHYVAYRTTGDAGVPESIYFRTEDGSCFLTGGNSEPMQLVEPIDIETFVALEESLEVLDGDVARRVQTSADGAFVVVSGFDRGREEPCDFFDPRDGSGTVCLEATNRRHHAFSYWSDEACGEPAVVIDVCTDPTLPVRDYQLDECGEEQYVLREPGAPFEDHLHETFGNDAECVPQEFTFGIGVGAEIPIGSYPSLATLDLAGEGVSMQVAARGDRAISTWGPFRLPSGGACFVNEVADGSLRCVPLPVTEDLRQFADSDCTVPLARVGLGDLRCGQYAHAAVFEDPQECFGDAAILELFELGEPHRGAVYEIVDEVCVEMEVGRLIFAPLGASVPLDSLPPIELRVE